jgi:hypothetical protein
MEKGESDRGVRTNASGVTEDIPIEDARAGDEGIDDGLAGKRFKPGKPESYAQPGGEPRVDANKATPRSPHTPGSAEGERDPAEQSK